MKRISTLIFGIMLLVGANAQGTSNFIVFSADGEPFYLVLNGIKQNADPETNVKVTGINEGYYKIKIIFKDTEIPDLDKSWPINPSTEATGMIEMDKKGNYKLKYWGEIPISDATSVASDQVQYVYITQEPAATPVEETVVVTETMTTTTTTDGRTNENTGDDVSVNINMGGVNFNMDVDVDDAGYYEQDATSSQTTTTTTYTSTTSATNTNTTTNTNATEQVVYVDGYTGTTGCYAPKNDSEFKSAKASVQKETFDDDKMMVAKQMTKNSCLTVDQVKEIVNLFDFSDDQLDYAKYAYDYTYDQGNYYKVNDCFDFSSDKEELNAFLNSK